MKMTVSIISLSKREGTGKESGNAYCMCSFSGLVPIPTTKKLIVSEHNTFSQDGFKLLTMDIEETIYKILHSQITDLGFPQLVDLELLQDVNQKGELIQIVESASLA